MNHNLAEISDALQKLSKQQCIEQAARIVISFGCTLQNSSHSFEGGGYVYSHQQKFKIKLGAENPSVILKEEKEVFKENEDGLQVSILDGFKVWRRKKRIYFRFSEDDLSLIRQGKNPDMSTFRLRYNPKTLRMVSFKLARRKILFKWKYKKGDKTVETNIGFCYLVKLKEINSAS